MAHEHELASHDACCACCADHTHSHEDAHADKRRIARFVAGAALFGTGIVIERVLDTSPYIAAAVFLAAYLLLGAGVLLHALKNIARGRIFDENFLMSVATIGAFVIGDFPEAAAVMLFYQIGESFQEAAVRRSRKSIADLMDIRPDYANLKRGGEVVRVSPDELRVGDIIIVKAGEKFPVDGVVTNGEARLDMTALTGESAPRKVGPADAALSGCVNLDGLLTVEVTKIYSESTVAKIIELVENAGSKKAPTENFITKFSRYYTPIVVLLAALVAVVPPLALGGAWSEWVNKGLIFLVVSCPCALVISIPLSFFCGIGAASRKGVLVKGGNFLEALSELDIVVFDKTGTLTKGVFRVTNILTANGFSDEAVLAAAARAESFSNHPIAVSIRKAYDKDIDADAISDYRELSGQGVSAVVRGENVLVGNHKLMTANGIAFTETGGIGTKVYVAVRGAFAGCVVVSDEIKPDSGAAIAKLRTKGVRLAVMLTGDERETAEAVSAALGLDEVHAGLLPAQKVEALERLYERKRANGKLAFVGDGINDAPVLARSDVGIAMGALGADAAIEAADVVLMTDEPSKLAVAADVAKATKHIVRQNIVFVLVVKGVFLLLSAFGYTTMWEAVFADVGVALLAVLNATRIARMSAK